MRLLMLGYFGFGNAGDEAVLAAEVAALRCELGPATEFVVVSGDLAHTRRVHDLPAVSRTDFGAILRAIRACDGVVAGGGSLLQDVTSARPVAFYAGVMLAARALRRPVFVYSQGLGPLSRPANRWLAGRALRAATYVSLRDADSVELARTLGGRHLDGIDLVPDPVLGLPIEPVSTRDAVAVALRPWHGQSDWLPPVVEALEKLAESHDIVLVPFHAHQDSELAHTVATRLGPRASVVEPDGGYRAAVTAIASSRAVLGMRLHALIAAAAAGRSFVALSYDPKVTAFATRCRQPVAATVPGPPIEPPVLARAVRAALDEPLPAGLAGDPAVPAREIARALA